MEIFNLTKPFSKDERQTFKRQLTANGVSREGGNLKVTFSVGEMERVLNFIERMQKSCGTSSYHLCIIDENKWYESRIIDREGDSVIDFEIYKEDQMLLGGNVLDI